MTNIHDGISLKGAYAFRQYAAMDSIAKRIAFRIVSALFPSRARGFLDRYAFLKDSWSTCNVVTSAGKAQLALLGGDSTATPFTYIAVGTSATAVTAADTTLTAEVVDTGLQRAAGTFTRTTTTVANDTYKLTKTFTATGSKTIEEVGVFNASSAGTMLSHSLTTTKSLASGDQLVIEYSLTFA